MARNFRTGIATAITAILVSATSLVATTAPAVALGGAAPTQYKADRILGYQQDADDNHVDNTLTTDVAAPIAEFGGKIITFDDSNHVFATDPTTNQTVDLTLSVFGSTPVPNFYSEYGAGAGITSVQFDGKFWMWFDSGSNGYDLFYSDGTTGGSGIVPIHAASAHTPDTVQTIGTPDGIYFAVEEGNSNSTRRVDLHYWDGLDNVAPNVVDINVATDAGNPDGNHWSSVEALRNLGGKASFVLVDYSTGNFDQYYMTGSTTNLVGTLTFPSTASTSDTNWSFSSTGAHGQDFFYFKQLYWGSQTASAGYFQLERYNQSSEVSTYFYENSVWYTSAYNSLYHFVPDTVDQVNWWNWTNGMMFDGSYYYRSPNNDIVKVTGLSRTVVVSSAATDLAWPDGFTVANNRLYFTAQDQVDYTQPIKYLTTDGSLVDVFDDWDNEDWNDDEPIGAGVDGAFFFSQYDNQFGQELYVADDDGVRISQNIEFGNDDSYPWGFATLSGVGKVCFSAINNYYGYGNDNYGYYGYYELYCEGEKIGSTLPAGDTAFALNADSTTPSSFFEYNTATGLLDPIGDETQPTNDSFGQAAYDETTGLSYAIDWSYSNFDGPSLVNVDVNTGKRTLIGQPYDYDADYFPYLGSLAIDSNGNAFGVDQYGGLYQVNLETAEVLYVGQVRTDPDAYGNLDSLYELAFDPTTDTLYGMVDYDDREMFIVTIETNGPDAGLATVVGNWFDASNGLAQDAGSLQFDSNGKMWIVDTSYLEYYRGDYVDDDFVTVWNADPENVNGTATLISASQDTYGSLYWESMLITRGDNNSFDASVAPDSETLYALNGGYYSDYFLRQVDRSDATISIGVGDGVAATATDFGQAAWDASTNKAYAVDFNQTYSNWNVLSEINLQTGRPTVIGEFGEMVDGDRVPRDIVSIAIDADGNAFAVGNDQLYSVDLDTAELTFIGALNCEYCDFHSLAFNNVNGTLYGISQSSGQTYTIDTSDATTTLLDTSWAGDYRAKSLQFSGSGVAFVLDTNGDIYKGAISDGYNSFDYIGQLFDYSNSLLLVPHVLVPADLPAGDGMYALNADSTMTYSVASINTSTGALTGQGYESTPGNDRFEQAAYDETSGLSYALDESYGQSPALVLVDVQTGRRTFVASTWSTQDDDSIDLLSMAIDSNGNAFAVDSAGGLWSLNLDTGELLYVHDISTTDQGYGQLNSIWALAFDPTTDELYGAQYDYDNESFIFTIDTTNGNATVVGNWNTATGGNLSSAAGFQFDSNGVLWIVDEGWNYDTDEPVVTVWNADTSDINGTAVQAMPTTTFDGGPIDWWSFLITRGTETAVDQGTATDAAALYTLTCDAMPYTMVSVNDADATGTGVGTAVARDNLCFNQPAWDAAGGAAYAVDKNYESGNSVLSRINPENGRPTMIAEFIDGDGYTVDMNSMAIDANGHAYGYGAGQWWSIDLGTGEVVSLREIDEVYDALAFNPKDGKFYGINALGYDVIEIDPTDGTPTVLGSSEPADPGQIITSLQFDGDGVAYVLNVNQELRKGDITNLGESELIGSTTVGIAETGGIVPFSVVGPMTERIGFVQTNYNTHALLLKPVSASSGGGSLGSTGVDANSVMALGVIAVAAGIVLVARRRKNAI